MVEKQNRMRRWAPLLGVVAVLAMLAGVTVLKQQKGTGDAQVTDESDLQSAQSQANPKAMGGAGVPGGGSAPMSAMTAQKAVAGILAARQKSRAEQAETTDRINNSLISAYRAETANPVWAERSERKLLGLATGPSITGAGVKADDIAIDCKRTTCRTTASFSSSAQADDWAMLYMASVGETLRNSVVTRTKNADGSVSVDIYSRAN